MRGINARSKLALSIVVAGFDTVASKKLLEEAKCAAYWEGRSAEAYGITEPPFLFKDAPELLEQWQQAYDLKDYVGVDAQAPRGFTPEELRAITAQITNIQTEAMKCCGLSDVLYDKQIQKSFENMIFEAPACLEQATITLLRSHGYDPEFEPFDILPALKDRVCAAKGKDQDHHGHLALPGARCPCPHAWAPRRDARDRDFQDHCR